MENELEIFITNLDIKYIDNLKTGERKEYCMVTYLVPKENTNRSKGCARLSCYCSIDAFNKLDKFMFKWNKAKVNNSVDEKLNRMKLKIKSVNDVVVS